MLCEFGAEIAIEAMACAAGVGTFMDVRRVERWGIVKSIEIRHMNTVFNDVVIRIWRPKDGVDAELSDKILGAREALAFREDRSGLVFIALDLLCVEQAKRPRKMSPVTPCVGITVIVVPTRACGGLFPENANT